MHSGDRIKGRGDKRSRLAGALLLLLVAVFGWAGLKTKPPAMPGFAVSLPSTSPRSQEQEPLFLTRFASTSVDDYVHSASLAPLPGRAMMAAWFAGSREGAPDVDIRAAKFDAASEEWGPEFTLVSRPQTESSLNRHIRKLGNPVLALAPNDRLWLFYVSVSIGGWSTSSINAMYSDDGGASWSAPRRLVTSPFLNISTLVRNSPVFHEDGSIGLPVYHECFGKFAEYLQLDPEGRIIDKFRISKGRYGLQPTIVALSKDSAVALLRNAGESPRKVLTSFTSDRGQTWSEPVPNKLWNPNSSLAAVSVQDSGEILVVLNNLQNGRYRLSLYETDAKLDNWRLLKVLDQSPHDDGEVVPLEEFRTVIQENYLAVGGPDRSDRLGELLPSLEKRACNEGRDCEIEFEYPSFISRTDGVFHVAYSWNNSIIKHVKFNRAWLARQ